MSKKYDTFGILTLGSENTVADKESAKAQKRWEKDGTITTQYLEHALGDITEGISATAPGSEEKQDESENVS